MASSMGLSSAMLASTLFLAISLPLAAPAQELEIHTSAQQNHPRFTKSCVRFRILSRDTSYTGLAELALSPQEQSWGMMYRRNIPDQSAMLFDMKGKNQVHFWMKNTPSSLDIAFFDTNGRLAYLEPDARPFSTDYLGPDPDVSVSYVLEIPAGQAEILGLYADGPVLQVATPSDCAQISY